MPTSSSAYATVAEAIRFVRASARRQPSLDEIAAHVGLSPAHLQRTFSAWAGISPKRFLQFLTKEHARSLLRASRDVLGASLDTGLSGPGRLHDLLVHCDAMTPGEMGALGEGLTVAGGVADSPLGRMVAGITPRGICHLAFIDDDDEPGALQVLRDEWPRADWRRDDAAVAALSRTMFAGPLPDRPLSVLLRGTNFQIKVWEALLRIPAGHVVAYHDVASASAVPGASRAVGSAIARNRIAVLVPCHRVIRESGDFGEYRWGSERKCALLARERARQEATGAG